MFSDIDKILMKYFKKKKESPLATLNKTYEEKQRYRNTEDIR